MSEHRCTSRCSQRRWYPHTAKSAKPPSALPWHRVAIATEVSRESSVQARASAQLANTTHPRDQSPIFESGRRAQRARLRTRTRALPLRQRTRAGHGVPNPAHGSGRLQMTTRSRSHCTRATRACRPTLARRLAEATGPNRAAALARQLPGARCRERTIETRRGPCGQRLRAQRRAAPCEKCCIYREMLHATPLHRERAGFRAAPRFGATRWPAEPRRGTPGTTR